MLKLLLDEHISPAVARGVRKRLPAMKIFALSDWEDGGFLGQDDAVCLAEASRQHLTFVTYDRRTIPPLLKMWAETGNHHAGVIFVDHRTIPPSEIGTLVRGLVALAMEQMNWEWRDRVCFLRL
jgi:hypothetical protein